MYSDILIGSEGSKYGILPHGLNGEYFGYSFEIFERLQPEMMEIGGVHF